MKITSTTSGNEFEYRTTSDFTGKGSEIYGEVLIAGEWRRADGHLKGETLTIYAGMEGYALEGILSNPTKLVSDWILMKNKNLKKAKDFEKNARLSQEFEY